MSKFAKEHPSRPEEQLSLPFAATARETPKFAGAAWSSPLTPPPGPKQAQDCFSLVQETLRDLTAAPPPRSSVHEHRTAIFERAANALERISPSTHATEVPQELLTKINGAMLESAISARRHSLYEAATTVCSGVRLLLALDLLAASQDLKTVASPSSFIDRYRDLFAEPQANAGTRAPTARFKEYLCTITPQSSDTTGVPDILRDSYLARLKAVLGIK